MVCNVNKWLERAYIYTFETKLTFVLQIDHHNLNIWHYPQFYAKIFGVCK